MDAARRLIGERGLAVTLGEIADQAGLHDPALDPAGHDPDRIVEALFGQRLDDPASMPSGRATDDQARGAAAGAEHVPFELAEFQTLLTSLLSDRNLTVVMVARHLAVSKRTLQRRLSQHGTNWRIELDAARRREASELMCAGASNEIIAARLGYSDTRALRRALARWNARTREQQIARTHQDGRIS